MIVNTGQRTDIPGFYAQWFAKRLQEGLVMVRNPYSPSEVIRYRLNPEVVDLIAMCTKNPAPMLPHLDLLKPYGQYWHVTITPYGREIEPNVPSKRTVLETFRRLSDAVGPGNVVWRYDPVFISDTYPVARHLKAFEYMASYLDGFTRAAVISFIDLYEKTRRNFPEAREVNAAQRMELGKAFVEIGSAHGMAVRPCGEGRELEVAGADCRGCMTVEIYEQALGKRLKVPQHAPARKMCACYLGGEIGAYNSCGHFCRYCYANTDAETVRRNMARHDPDSPLLIGHLMPGDTVRDAKQESWTDGQMIMKY